jgi:glycine betaine/proline transport system substrate-binding protein
MKGSPSLLLVALLSAIAGPGRRTRAVPDGTFSDVGWTDITVTTATTSVVLEAWATRPTPP